MNCITPPGPEDRLLLAYLDGEADPETELHLQQCPFCRERIKDLAREQNALVSLLYRVSCPSPEELGEYHLHVLSPDRALVIAQHVRECPHCTREIAQLEDYLSDLAPQPGLIKSVKVLIARLVSRRDVAQDADGSPQIPAFAGMRGNGEEPFIYQADDIQIVIDVQDDAKEIDRKNLLGLVTGLELNDFVIQVSQGGQVIDSSAIDENGNFQIEHLASGIYELTLLGPEVEVHIQSFKV